MKNLPLETGLLLRFESFLNGFSGTLAGGLLYGIVRHWGNLEGIELTLAQVLFLAFVFGLTSVRLQVEQNQLVGDIY